MKYGQKTLNKSIKIANLGVKISITKDKMGRSNIHLIEVPEGKNREKGRDILQKDPI